MTTLPRMTTPGRVLSPYLDPVQLMDYSRFVADEVLAGRYPFVQFDDQTRWHQRIYRDRRVDVWLISWLPSQGTQLHDHGESSGSFTVVSGVLTESLPESGSLARREWGAHQSVGFGAPYVHDVRNVGPAPAVSVHVYSPPLTKMNFYDLADNGSLEHVAQLATDDPESDAPKRAALNGSLGAKPVAA